jgi:prolyl-tRNA editing enzyme YbaK/EbsC (Cys-tRNA(Pro) deacylase)
VQAALAALGLDRRVVDLGVDARTAAQAAGALGVDVGQIAKSLVFTVNGAPVLVIASGRNRVDETKLGALAGGRVKRADPETVRQATGYAIGGVPPVGHASRMPVFIDDDLRQHALVYAAAGAPECVFPITPDEMVRITQGCVADLRDDTHRQKGVET